MKLARARYKQAEDADNKQLEREIDDLRFLNDQWSEELKNSRGPRAAKGTVPSVPARPCLTIDTLRDPIAHVAAEAQQTDLGPELTPADDFAELVGHIDDTEIELREGLLRRIQRESDARDARNWAADRARKAGRGYYVVMTRYVSQRSMDQEVYIDRLYNQSTVRMDPRHEKPDGSDAEWEFWGTDMSWEQYKSEHPNRPSAPKREDEQADNDEWRGLGDEAPDWFTTGDKDTRSVRVMNYFYTDRKPVKLVQLEDGRTVKEDEVPKGAKLARDEDGKPITRDDVEKTIKWAKIDGAQKLDETEWESPFMPIVKVLWEEVQPYDTERRVQGMIRPARDPAFGVSVMASTEVEVALMAPRSPVIGYAGQFEGFEEAWNESNTRNIGRLEFNAYTDQVPVGGGPLPPPGPLQRNSQLGEWDGLRQMFTAAVKSSTGVPDATLGNVDPSVRSGRAIRQLIEQSRQGTSGGLANLVRSVTYEARIVNSLLYPIYGRRSGRLLQMMTGAEGKYESKGAIVGTKEQPKPFVLDEKKRPQPFDPNQHAGQTPQNYKLTPEATFNVAIRVSKDFDTARQEEASTLGDLIQADPQLLTWFGDLFFSAQDGPGHKEYAKRAKLMLAPPIQQQLTEQDGGLPPQAQAMIQQLQQQLQQATQFIQTKQAEAQGDIEKTKAKAAADMQIEQLKAQLQIRLKEMDNAKAIEVARIGAAKEAMNAQAEAQEERLSTGLTIQHEATQNALDRQHDVNLALHQSEQAANQQDAQQGHEAVMAQQAQQAAAQQPNGAGA